MEAKQFSLPYIVQVPPSQSEESDARFPVIVALHRRGSNEMELIGLAPDLSNEFLWVSPRGVFSLGPNSFEWFPITQIGKPDPIRLANALDTIDHLIDEIIQTYPVDKNKLYLLGFSQGSVVSLSYALTRPQRVAGAISQSGYIPHESGLKIDEMGVRNKPFIFTHGTQDSILPVDWARRSRETLQKLGADLEYHEFDMGHEVSAESLSVISTWLEKQLRT